MIELRQLCRDFLVGEQVVHALDHIDLKIAAMHSIDIHRPQKLCMTSHPPLDCRGCL